MANRRHESRNPDGALFHLADRDGPRVSRSLSFRFSTSVVIPPGHFTWGAAFNERVLTGRRETRQRYSTIPPHPSALLLSLTLSLSCRAARLPSRKEPVSFVSWPPPGSPLRQARSYTRFTSVPISRGLRGTPWIDGLDCNWIVHLPISFRFWLFHWSGKYL